jgi:hypothetical protein
VSDLSPESIIQVASGYMAAKELLVAVEIGLFETLAEGAATIDELGQRTNRLEEAVRTDRIIFGESGFTEEERLYSAGVEAVTAGTAQALARTSSYKVDSIVTYVGRWMWDVLKKWWMRF